MLPTLHRLPFRSSRLILSLVSAALHHVPSLQTDPTGTHTYAKREVSRGQTIAFGCLIPILVILSGVFAGLTLGYMSLDETQLNVLSISGTPKQKLYANKIKPIRKDGHLLLVTLLLANMIVNETLPVIADSVLGGGIQSVVVSTVLIVIFSEIIPQSLCTRYGLYFGAKMAGPTRVLIWTLGIVSYPVAKLLEFVLGPHHGIIYRRAELKELIAMHSNMGELGGDLKTDTVTIIGGALDLQEKVVKQAMTPIEDVFMLSIETRLDYETLRKICLTGHSRVPVYEEVEIPAPTLVAGAQAGKDSSDVQTSQGGVTGATSNMIKAKKIIGILLVKQCVLLDPKDATPLRKIPLNKVPLVPHNESLLGILDKFQDGRSHMAIVSRFSVERAASVKQAVKRGLTQRLREAIKDSDSEEESGDSEDEGTQTQSKWRRMRRKRTDRGEQSSENEETLQESSHGDGSDDAASRSSGGRSKKHTKAFGGRGRRKQKGAKPEDVDLEMGIVENLDGEQDAGSKSRIPSLALPRMGFWGNEQNVPADAVLSTEGAEELLQSVDPAVMPLGIITLEDVLEELIGEEIYDEFDPQGHPDLSSYYATETKPKFKLSGGPAPRRRRSAPQLAPMNDVGGTISAPVFVPSSTSVAADADGNPFASPNASPKIQHAQPALPIAKPTAMPALPLRGLNALNLIGLGSKVSRSRSAPPVPRDAVHAGGPHDGDSTPTVLEEIVITPPLSVTPMENQRIDDQRADQGPPGMSDIYAIETDTHQPVPNVPQVINADASARVTFSPPRSPTPSSSSHPNVQPALMPAAVPPSVNISLAAASKPASRSSSPSPSLEHAILIERKRRAASAGAGSMPGPKGARFKSSPLTGDRSGVIVAEKVRKEMSVDEEPEPSSEKEGPDIEKE